MTVDRRSRPRVRERAGYAMWALCVTAERGTCLNMSIDMGGYLCII
jgi:hypothetical protein